MNFATFNDFLIACIGASASFIGLLFVSLSVLNRDNNGIRIEFGDRRLAESSFASLTNIFFVSLVGIMPETNIGWPALVMAILGLLTIFGLLRRFFGTEKEQNPVGRTKNMLWIFVSFVIYGAEGICGVLLILNPANQSYVSFIMYVLIALFSAALTRAWTLTGIRTGK